MTSSSSAAALPASPPPCSSAEPATKVTVLDTGLPRNRFAGHSHGLLGHDHKPPLDILAEARQQLARYPTIRLVSARADSVSGAIDHFSVLTGDGGYAMGSTLVDAVYIATDGARDDFAVMNALRAECPLLSKECLVGQSVATLLTRLKNDINTLIGMLPLDSVSRFPSQNCRKRALAITHSGTLDLPADEMLPRQSCVTITIY